MSKKKKIIIIVSVVVGIAAIILAAYFIINAVMFRGPYIEYPFDGDGSEHTVMFDSNGGTEIDSVIVRDGNPVRRPGTPEKDGYFLTGWFKDENLDDEWNFDTDRVKSDLTLYAGWQDRLNLEPTASLTYERSGDGYAVTGVGEETVVVIPEEHEGLPVTAIGDAAFARKAITEITIPDGVTVISRNAFNNCTNLTAAHIGVNSSLSEIGLNAFSGCGVLGEFYLPAALEEIGDNAFNNCGSINFTVNGENTAYRSQNGHLIQTETQTLIRGGQSSAIPEGVLKVAQAAFRKSAAESILIPASVTEIGNNAFQEMAALKQVSVDENNANYCSFGGIVYNKAATAIVFVPKGLSGEIELAQTLAAIPRMAFDGVTGVTAIDISGELTEIGFAAFRNVTATINFKGTEGEWNTIIENSSSSWNTGATLSVNFSAEE